MSAGPETFLVFPLALVAFALGWLLVAVVGVFQPAAAWLPVRGRWRNYFLAGLPFLVVALLLPVSGMAGMLVCLGVAVAWWRFRQAFVDPSRGRRFKSVEIATGIRLIPETGGPPSAALRDELDLWQAAGLRAMAGMLVRGGMGEWENGSVGDGLSHSPIPPFSHSVLDTE